MADRVSSQSKRTVITNGYKRFSKTNSNDPRHRLPLSSPICLLANHNPLCYQEFDTIKSDVRVRMLGARGRVVQNGIGEAHMCAVGEV